MIVQSYEISKIIADFDFSQSRLTIFNIYINTNFVSFSTFSTMKTLFMFITTEQSRTVLYIQISTGYFTNIALYRSPKCKQIIDSVYLRVGNLHHLLHDSSGCRSDNKFFYFNFSRWFST
jgi:hypothetical protein